MRDRKDIISVPVAGGTLSIDHHTPEAGRGTPTLLFLHYWGGSAATWSPVIDLLPDRSTLAWDQRGWGAAADLPGPYELDALAADVDAVVSALELDAVVIVGHSQGGKVAQILARRQPPWLCGLVLVAPAPPRPPTWVTAEFRDGLSHAYDSPESIARALDGTLTARRLPPRLRDHVIRDSAAAHPRARRAWPSHGIAADLGPGTVGVPTSVIVGELDRVEPPAVLDELLLPTLPPHARLTVVPAAGHLLPLETPHAVAAAADARAAVAPERP